MSSMLKLRIRRCDTAEVCLSDRVWRILNVAIVETKLAASWLPNELLKQKDYAQSRNTR